jgi:hypothetical protein
VRPYLEKNPSPKRTDVVAQGVVPEFKPQHCKEKERERERERRLEGNLQNGRQYL